MYGSNATTSVINDDLEVVVGLQSAVSPDNIFTFAETGEFLTELFKAFYRPGTKLVSAGHVTPDVEMACDRAEVRLVESLGRSPFTGDVSCAASSVSGDGDFVYVSNPNRVTGSNFSLSDLDRLAMQVPRGILVVDEYYFDHCGITGTPLLDKHDNVVVLRSFSSPSGFRSSDAGYAAVSEALGRVIRKSVSLRPVSRAVRQAICAADSDSGSRAVYLKEIHSESLRLATELTGLGIQCRLTATDFLLFRVASPKDVGNFLSSHRVTIENLDGYPQMKGYMRYRLEGPSLNDRFMSAFKSMPPEYFRVSGLDRRALAIHRRKRASNQSSRSRRGEADSLASRVNLRKTSPLFVEK